MLRLYADCVYIQICVNAKSMKRRHIIYFFVILLLITSLSCKRNTSKQNNQSTHANRLELATNSEPDSLDPLFAEMAASHEIMFLGQRSLTYYDDKWNLVNDLAVEVPSVANGQVKVLPDSQKMVVTWHIKPDAVWEDGVPVTADDLIFPWQVCLDPNQEIIDRDTCERVESMKIEGTDKKTLIVTWRQPFAFFAGYNVHNIMPAHILASRYKKPGGGTNDMKKDPYGMHPLSNGPFKFKEWVPGQYITYVRNDRYQPRAKLDEVTFRIIPNNMSIESNLIAGTVDGVTTSGGLNIPAIEMIKKEHGDRFTYHSVPGMVWAHIDFNLDNPILKDIKVRRALARAINRRQIIQSIYAGQYQLANTFEPPLHWGYNPQIPELTFDLKESAKLFDEAGWKQKSPGEPRKNAKGEELVLKISAVAAVKDTEQFQQIFQSDLSTLGVSLQIDNKPAKVFFGDIARHRKFPFMSFYSWVSGPDSWSNTLWHQDYIPSAANNWQGQNYPGWKNAEASKLLDAIPSVLDQEKRAVMLRKVQELWFNDLPAIPMYFRPVVSITRKDFLNYKPTGTLTPVTWNASEWTFAKKPKDR